MWPESSKIGANYEILEGLSIGDEIVTNGTFTVDAAAQLQGKKSMMNKTGSKAVTHHEKPLGINEVTSSEIHTLIMPCLPVEK